MESHEANDSVEEKLAALAGRGMIKLSAKPVKFSTFKFSTFKRVAIPGKLASQIIIEERR